MTLTHKERNERRKAIAAALANEATLPHPRPANDVIHELSLQYGLSFEYVKNIEKKNGVGLPKGKTRAKVVADYVAENNCTTMDAAEFFGIGSNYVNTCCRDHGVTPRKLPKPKSQTVVDGTLLIAYLLGTGLTQSDVAARVGKSREWVSQVAHRCNLELVRLT
jgi:hypothetical protein